MLRRKILFWLVWILACPFVFIYYVAGRRSQQYYLSNMPAFKTGLVRQAVWEKMVVQKAKKRGNLREYRSAGADQFQNRL